MIYTKEIVNNRAAAANFERAQALGLNGLRVLCEDEVLLSQFITASGASVDDIRAGAEDPGFLGGILGFILSDDAAAQGLCRALEIVPDELMRAHRVLSGIRGNEE